MSKLTLDSVEWKEFRVKDVFSVDRGKRLIERDRLPGVVPYYSASSINNGVTDFISNPLFTDKNKLLVTTFCDSYYADGLFTASDEITILGNEYLNKNNGIFLSQLIKSNSGKYAFGRKAFSERVKEQLILLPIEESGNPHWQFMEDYIKQERKKQAIQIRNYYEPKLLMLAGELAGLEEVEWKIFELKELFEFERGNQNNMAKCQQGEVPLISAKKIDNGVKTFIKDNGKKLFKGNILTLNNDGDGGVGIAYYQSSVTALDTHVTALIPKFKANKNLLLFLSQLITMQRDKFSHGYSLNNLRLSKQRIMLPVDTYGNPNWQYMEDYVKRLELEQIENILEYIYIYRTISFHRDFQKSKSIEWKEFWLEDVCEIQPGVRLTQSDMVEGERPFIGATEFNNGITAFVSNTNKSLDSNVLGVNYNGSVVKSFYHEYECIFSDDVKRLKVKDTNYQNKYIYLFLKQVILQQERKYAYGYKFNASRMKRQKIMLPVLEDGNIDFEYMIDQMKWLEFKEIFKLLSSIR